MGAILPSPNIPIFKYSTGIVTVDEFSNLLIRFFIIQVNIRNIGKDIKFIGPMVTASKAEAISLSITASTGL